MTGNSDDRGRSARAVTTEDDESMDEDSLTMRSSPRDQSQEPLLAMEANTSASSPVTETEEIPVRITSQHEILTRNLAQLPAELEVREHSGGVWTRQTLSRGTRYGPLFGKWAQEPMDLRYAWEVRVDGCGIRGFVDANVKYCNWLKFIRSTNQIDARNLRIVILAGQAYYETSRDINASEELLTGPRDSIHLEMYAENTTISEDRSDRETESQHSGTIEDERDEGEEDEATTESRCTVCGKEFEENDLLDDHLVSCHRYPPDQFKCDRCPKGFSWKPCLFRHRVLEHGEVRRYPCENCSKVFTDPSNLQRHIRTHHVGARSHACQECGKTFATSSGLKQHTHIHSSVKPFQCEVCFKAYTQFSNLCRHKRMHADCRMQIKCVKCGQSFSTVTSLSKHKRFCDSTTPNTTPNSSALHSHSTLPPNSAAMAHLPHSQTPAGHNPFLFYPPRPTGFPLYPSSLIPPYQTFFPHPSAPPPPFLGNPLMFSTKMLEDDPLRRLNLHVSQDSLHSRRNLNNNNDHSNAALLRRPTIDHMNNGIERDCSITPPQLTSPPKKISPPSADEAVSNLRPSPARPLPTGSVSYSDPRESLPVPQVRTRTRVSEADSNEDTRENTDSPKDFSVPKVNRVTDENIYQGMEIARKTNETPKPMEVDRKCKGEQPLDLRVGRKREREETPDDMADQKSIDSPISSTPSPKRREECKTKDEEIVQEKKIELIPAIPYSRSHTPFSIADKISSTSSNRIQSPMAYPRPVHPMPMLLDMYRAPFPNFPPPPSPSNDRLMPPAPIPFGPTRGFPFIGPFNGMTNGHIPGRISFDPRNSPIHSFPAGKPYQSVLPPHIPNSSTDGQTGANGKLKDRYSCKFCGKVFPRSANLTRHLRTHTGEQPYKCKYCERSFSISSNLQRHVRNIHNKEKPFKCPLCDRCFGQQTNLDRHLKKHEADDGSGVVSVADSPGSSNENERDESYFDEIRSFMGKVTPYTSGSYANEPIINSYNMQTPIYQTPNTHQIVDIVHKDEDDSDITSEENSPPHPLDMALHQEERIKDLRDGSSPVGLIINKDIHSPVSFEVKLKSENSLKDAESTNNNCPEQESIEVAT